MAKQATLFGFGLALVAGAWCEPPDNAKPVDSVKAYKDVDPAADYMGSLQIVVDKYLLLGAYADDTFRPKEALRRGEVAGWLDRSAKRAESLIDIVSDDFKGNKEAFRRSAYPTGGSAYSSDLFQQVKDFPATDPCYPPAQHLAEHFHLVVVGPKGAFGASEPISADEYSGYLKSLFHYKGGPKGSGPITRSEAVDGLCDGFQFFLDQVELKLVGK